jgi:hypothetical protein
MTTKNGLLNKSFLEEPVQRIIERGRWANYARCRECGVDAGEACRDEDDHEALEVCDGRRLAIDDVYAKCKAPKPDAPTKRNHVSKKKTASPPVYVPCQHCGEPVRLWGQGVAVGRGWCSTLRCWRARKAEQGRLVRERQRERRLEAERIAEATAPRCSWCDVRLHHAWSARPACMDRRCRNAKKREEMREKRALDRSRKVDNVATEVRE